MTDTAEDMRIDPSRAHALISQLGAVKNRISSVAAGRSVRLVAVSKLKPANDILALHQAPTSHSHFGENYAQELGQKAELLPKTIQWHFIGGLQSGEFPQSCPNYISLITTRGSQNNVKLRLGDTKGHCKSIAKIPNLFCVSSVDTAKKAQLLNSTRAAASLSKLSVHVQVNTSGEESKSGCAPGEETIALCKEIVDTCPSLHLLGLMTIGAIARSKETTPENDNEDFITLKEQRDLVAKELGLDESKLELSMGMSEDFEGAIRLGSGEVRVGSTIFGQRPAKADAKIKE